jgi:hypothetical protein
MTHFGIDSWSFPPLPGSVVPRTVHFTPRLVVNSVRGAVASAIDGCGVTRVFSCQIAEHVRQGELAIVLAGHEEPPIPVHLLAPTGRLAMPKARAFVDFAVPRLRSYFGLLAKELEEIAARSRCGKTSAEQHTVALGQMLDSEIDGDRSGRHGCEKSEPDSVPTQAPRIPTSPHIHPDAPWAPNRPEPLAVA